jgi:hypothetical protein
MGSISEPGKSYPISLADPNPSFPRKRESKGFNRLPWTPAFAGVTN